MKRQEYMNKSLLPLTLLNVAFGMHLGGNGMHPLEALPLLFILPVVNIFLAVILFKE